MGVTQYIGARYVPIFADPAEWTSTRTYEPLTIVLHEGNSYTSKKFVPAGINITNENFWAETGNYNAQVEAYRKEVNGFNNRITENENNISIIKNKYNKIYDTVDEMKNDKNIEPGMTVKTIGYHSTTDMGGSFYNIVENTTANEMDVIKVSNNLYAQLIYEPEMTIDQFGASTTLDDNSKYVNYAFTKCRALIIPVGTYNIKSTIIFPSDNLNIRGIDEINSVIKNNGLASSAPMIEIPIEYANFIIQNFTLDARDLDNRGIKALHPYDACVIRDMHFNNFTMAAIFCGYEDDSKLSQTLYCENNLIYTSGKARYLESPVIMHRVYELNFTNNKILNRQVSPYPCLLLSFTWDAFIRGNSFLKSANCAIQANGQLRFSRFIGNTYEDIATSDSTIPQQPMTATRDMIVLNENVADQVGSSSSNIFIEEGYYNAARKIRSVNGKLQKSIAIGTCFISGGSQNINISSYAMDSNTNKAIDDLTGNNATIGSLGTTLYSASGLGITNPTSKIRYYATDSSSATADYGVRFYKVKDDVSTMLLQMENTFSMELTQNSGQYRLRDANGKRYRIYVTTNGELKCDPL